MTDAPLFEVRTAAVWFRWYGPDRGAGGTVTASIGEPSAQPRLFEETKYRVDARSLIPGRRLTLWHEDPELRRKLLRKAPGEVSGPVNFKSWAGLSRFVVEVRDAPGLTVDVEVFPSKLDYRADYHAMRDSLDEIAEGVAWSWLAPTLAGVEGRPERGEGPGWLHVLRRLLPRLERGLAQAARRPLRMLRPEPTELAPHRIRRVTAATRAAVRRRGRGASTLPTTVVEPSSDVPEHRWLRLRILALLRRLAPIVAAERRALDEAAAATPVRTPGPRRQARAAELEQMEERLAALLNRAPLRGVSGPVPVGFSSLRLLRTPGYRAAYGALMAVDRGLRFDGSSLHLPIKRLSTLYEAWGLLFLLEALEEAEADPIGPDDAVAIDGVGTAVIRFVDGQTFRFSLARRGGGVATLHFNPYLKKLASQRKLAHRRWILVDQHPDYVIEIERPDGSRTVYALDAKYRVAKGGAAPPSDSYQVLHRYRDALMLGPNAERETVEAVILFPMNADRNADFLASPHFAAISGAGLGAIPLTPSNTAPLTAWVDRILG
ncbi:MAG: DUF2357 domain-containing protein [Proteobacteria bacterium]|nr:DUF2357 domain-containing protein [Pseudomonadota bacterium]